MPVPGLGDASSVEETVVTEDAMEKATEDAGGSGDGAAMAKPAARTVRITASNWQFTPSTITVKKGEQVTLEVVGSEGIHGFAIRELGINVGVDLGNTVSIVLPTSTPGTYAFFCSVPCGEGHKDMKGTIIIGE
jgi:cytochrome c oxidase subunit II